MRCVLALGVALVATSAAAESFTIDGNCRDGNPHGAYELRGAGGQVRAVGAFNRGKRMGSFLFWSGAGVRIAQLPYDEDVLSGTMAAWYPNGRVRAEIRYDNGMVADAHAYSESGKALSEAEARALAARDRVAHAQLVASLESLVRAHLPRCDPASDRLEKG